jgi:hypothetical protein
MPRHLDPGHEERRATLRVVGPVVLGIGLLFTLVGFGSFFSSFGSFGPPRYFWCAFVGLPLLALGSAICRFAFMGAVTRYMANEVAPVGKDVVNYMADGTKDAVRDVATAIGEGLASSRGEHDVEVVRCHKCNETNRATARFCNNCGESLSKSVACSKCGELNDPDARFCDNCGQGIA